MCTIPLEGAHGLHFLNEQFDCLQWKFVDPSLKIPDSEHQSKTPFAVCITWI